MICKSTNKNIIRLDYHLIYKSLTTPWNMSVLFTSIQVHRFVREKALHTNILGLEKPSCGSIYIFIISDMIPAKSFLGSNLPEVFGGEHRLPNIRAPKKSRVTSAFFGLPSASIYPDNEEQLKIAVFGLQRVIWRKYFGSSLDETHQKTCPRLA